MQSLVDSALAECVDRGAEIGLEHRPLVDLARRLEVVANAAKALVSSQAWDVVCDEDVALVEALFGLEA